MMNPTDISHLDRGDEAAWDAYVHGHEAANLYHLSGWREVIESTYGHDTHFLVARHQGAITGICPLVHLKHFIFGNTLYSLPFFDLGGILADDRETEAALLEAAMSIARDREVASVELRNADSADLLEAPRDDGVAVERLSHKVRMVLDLPGTSEELMQSFKTKFRTKVRLPAKKGCTCRYGGAELVDEFYKVFCVNMRDLGSPVHSRKLFDNVMRVFADDARLFIVDKDDQQLAAGMVIGFRDMLFNPWASALKEWSNIRPNTHLYWNILEYAIGEGFKRFDFGRSDPGGNTFVFKQSWGAEPVPVNWYRLQLDGHIETSEDKTGKSRFDTAIHYWKKLPVPVANLLGPGVRKHIGL